MGEVCRLCCSTKFVNNNIFDEENALYLKMSLYLPIKVFKNDRLPQKICDKCSCKVNDFYQFCNEAIEVQNRLRMLLINTGIIINESIDLTLIKDNASPTPTVDISRCEQSTQTEDCYIPTVDDNVKVKEELRPDSPMTVKEEDRVLEYDNFEDRFSDNSDDISLITLKEKKRSKKSDVNGGISEKRGRKKKAKLKDWEMLMNALPEGTALTVAEVNGHDVKTAVKEETPEVRSTDLQVSVELKRVKREPMDVFHCCICFTQCYRRYDMLQHYREHANESSLPAEPPAAPPPPDAHPLRCTRCRKAVTREEWDVHWKRHWERDRKPYRCALCEKTFRDHHQILKHGMTHNYEGGEIAQPPKKRFVCDLCPEGFVYMRYLLAHRARAHPEAVGRALALRCGQCARTFSHLNSLRRHLHAHSGARDHLCNVCGKALSSREHLKFHIRIHTGYKPNVCKTCGKGFVKKCNLTLHERVHSGEKPHVCSHCGKAFSQRSTLVIHERYHSGARPYVCELCGRGFVAKGLLSMHLKTTCV